MRQIMYFVKNMLHHFANKRDPTMLIVCKKMGVFDENHLSYNITNLNIK